jgi:hypothetical protein
MKEFKEISDKNPFKVPDEYFETVNRKIISATSGYGSDQKRISRYRKLRLYFAAAASVAVIAVLSYTAILLNSSGKNKSVLPEITLNEFSQTYLPEIDLLTLEESAGNIEPGIVSLNMDGKDIVDFLEFENIDISDIYTQL